MKTLLVLVALATLAHADPLRTDLLKVELKPATTRWRVKVPVDVALKVSNVTKQKQTIHVMSCSWEDHWASSDPALTWAPWGCDKNAPTPVELEPGKATTWTLPMFAAAGTKPGVHKLRMSFTPKDGALAWSNTVSITVVK